jgi:hypothetical protein
MRRALPLLLLVLAGCDPQTRLALTALDIGVVPVFGRTLPDLVVSGVAGKDCSMVRVEQGKPYCRQSAPPPEPQPFCTRSLGTVDCWSGPAGQPAPLRAGVADGPSRLTPEQEAYRTHGWPGL